jgi:hypothetical protein
MKYGQGLVCLICTPGWFDGQNLYWEPTPKLAGTRMYNVGFPNHAKKCDLMSKPR